MGKQTNSPENTSLIAFCEGNNEALLPRYKQLQQHLFFVAYKYLKNTEEVEDAVAETFEKLLRMNPKKRWEKFIEEKIELEAYLTVMVKNSCLDRHKVEGNRKRIISEVQDNAPKASFNRVWDNFLNYSVESMINYLPERERQILQMKIMGYSREEISEKMNISAKTVSNSLSISRSRLKTFWNFFM